MYLKTTDTVHMREQQRRQCSWRKTKVIQIKRWGSMTEEKEGKKCWRVVYLAGRNRNEKSLCMIKRSWTWQYRDWEMWCLARQACTLWHRLTQMHFKPKKKERVGGNKRTIRLVSWYDNFYGIVPIYDGKIISLPSQLCYSVWQTCIHYCHYFCCYEWPTLLLISAQCRVRASKLTT